jgi:DUF3102 family protein
VGAARQLHPLAGALLDGRSEGRLGDDDVAADREGKRAVADIEIGRRLIEAKAIAGHGNWSPWLEREFGWAENTAINFMRVAESAKTRNFRI